MYGAIPPAPSWLSASLCRGTTLILLKEIKKKKKHDDDDVMLYWNQ
jgi:hypothetical protein